MSAAGPSALQFGDGGHRRSQTIATALAFGWRYGFIAIPMNIKGVIFDMDGTITAPYFDFTTIKEEAGVGDVGMLDYLATATRVGHTRGQAGRTEIRRGGGSESDV